MNMTESQAEIINRYSYHRPDEAAVEKMKIIREKCTELALLIDASVPHGRDQSTALTHLQCVMMFSNAGIVNKFPIAE